MTDKWTPEGEAAYRQGFMDGMDSTDDPSPVISIIAGAFGGFITGLIVAAILYLVTG